MALYHSARPNPTIDQHAVFLMCYTPLTLSLTHLDAYCVLNFSPCVLSDENETTFNILIVRCIPQISTVSCRLCLWWE